MHPFISVTLLALSVMTLPSLITAEPSTSAPAYAREDTAAVLLARQTPVMDESAAFRVPFDLPPAPLTSFVRFMKGNTKREHDALLARDPAYVFDWRKWRGMIPAREYDEVMAREPMLCLTTGCSRKWGNMLWAGIGNRDDHLEFDARPRSLLGSFADMLRAKAVYGKSKREDSDPLARGDDMSGALRILELLPPVSSFHPEVLFGRGIEDLMVRGPALVLDWKKWGNMLPAREVDDESDALVKITPEMMSFWDNYFKSKGKRELGFADLD